jgi:hypothetical protein
VEPGHLCSLESPSHNSREHNSLDPPFSVLSPWLGCLQGVWYGSLSYDIRDTVEGVDVELSVRPWRLK